MATYIRTILIELCQVYTIVSVMLDHLINLLPSFQGCKVCTLHSITRIKNKNGRFAQVCFTWSSVERIGHSDKKPGNDINAYVHDSLSHNFRVFGNLGKWTSEQNRTAIALIGSAYTWWGHIGRTGSKECWVTGSEWCGYHTCSNIASGLAWW